MAVLYLLLKTTNPLGYRQLPSSKGKGEPYLLFSYFVKITAVPVGLDTSLKTLIYVWNVYEMYMKYEVITSEQLQRLETLLRKVS